MSLLRGVHVTTKYRRGVTNIRAGLSKVEELADQDLISPRIDGWSSSVKTETIRRRNGDAGGK